MTSGKNSKDNCLKPAMGARGAAASTPCAKWSTPCSLFYQLRTGCPWRDLPHYLPPWATVYDQFRRWRASGIIECLHDDLREAARKKQGREVSPSAAVLDNQTVKAGEKGGRPAPSATTPTRRSRAADGT